MGAAHRAPRSVPLALSSSAAMWASAEVPPRPATAAISSRRKEQIPSAEESRLWKPIDASAGALPVSRREIRASSSPGSAREAVIRLTAGLLKRLRQGSEKCAAAGDALGAAIGRQLAAGLVAKAQNLK